MNNIEKELKEIDNALKKAIDKKDFAKVSLLENRKNKLLSMQHVMEHEAWEALGNDPSVLCLNRKKLSIAIDGPAAAGKSTISKLIAEKLGLVYIDTGAMYRATALYCIRNSVPVNGWDAVNAVLSDIKIELKNLNGEQHIILNDECVDGYIRTESVSKAASDVSANPVVREKLVCLQRQIAEKESVIMDGRDIGTVVLPNADYKFYMTADVSVRAQRRYQELRAKGVECDYVAVFEDMKKRDYNDSHRETSPLMQAPGAIVVDTTIMFVNQVFDFILNIIQ